MTNTEQNNENEKEMDEVIEQAHEEPAAQPEPHHIDTTDVELNELKTELEEYRDKYFRQLAETENLRKRLLKEKDELVQYAIRNMICDFLHPIDNMENALGFTEQASEEVKHWAHGFKMILTQFKDVLANQGVRSFQSEGKRFDPHYHDAVDTVDTHDHEPGIVLEEILKGYSIGDKTLRPARVTVSKSPANEEHGPEQEESS